MKFILEEEDGTNDYRHFINQNIEEAEEIVIFGAGKGGTDLYELIMKMKAIDKLKAFSDNNIGKIGKKFLGKQVCEPALLKQRFPEATIFVASTAFQVITKQLIDLNYNKDKIIYTQLAGLSISEKNSDKQFIYKYYKEFEKAFYLLEDDKSRYIFINLLNYKITKKILYLELLSKYIDDEKEQYFDKNLINFNDNDVFVDCGSYTGDTLKSLFRHTNKNIKIIAFEADSTNYKRLEESCLSEKWNCQCYNLAVWSEQTKLHFDTTSYENGGGTICDVGGSLIFADSLDNILRKESINYIKMDIEGAEQKALFGASEVIKKNRPILSICVYHKPDDFYKIPIFIANLGLNYKFYFRQYRFGQSETVCYAIPE